MPKFTQQDVAGLFMCSENAETRAKSFDAALIGDLLKLNNGIYDLADEYVRNGYKLDVNGAKAAGLIGGKTLAAAKMLQSATGLGGSAAKAGLAATDVFFTSYALRALNVAKGASPGRAAGMIAVALLQKTSTVLGIADARQARCAAAVTSLVATTGATALSCSMTAGLGCAFGAALIVADGYQFKQACMDGATSGG